MSQQMETDPVYDPAKDDKLALIESSLHTKLVALARLLCLLVWITTLATLPARWFWGSDLLANLRIQQLIATSFCIVVCLTLRQRRHAAVATVCFIIHMLAVVPQCWPDSKRPTDSKSEINLLTVNVLSSNPNQQAIVREILESEAEVVAVLELNSQLARILKTELASQYPYEAAHPDDQGNFGIALYSKHELEQVRAFTLNESILSLETNYRGIRIIATHPLPPMGGRLFRSRNEHLSLLAARLKQQGPDAMERPIVVMGDFNVTPWSPHYCDFADECGLRRAKTGIGITPTWYARAPLFPFGLVLDHILISPELNCVTHRVGSDIGSDHRSVSAGLIFVQSLSEQGK